LLSCLVKDEFSDRLEVLAAFFASSMINFISSVSMDLMESRK
jgi:hypothetical protein